jgi:cytochrome c
MGQVRLKKTRVKVRLRGRSMGWYGAAFAILLTLTANAQQDLSEQSLKAADLVSGEQTWAQYCGFCHTLRSGEASLAGPNLHELFKRQVGSRADFDYSDALKNADRQWTPELFAEYVQNPGETLPGNRMAAVDLPPDKVVALTAFIMRRSGSVDWDAPEVAVASGGLDAELRDKRPAFWSLYMDNTVRFTVPRADVDEDYTFVAYFNADGTVTGNNRGLKGFWRMRDKRTFCYAIEGIAVKPYEWVECLPPLVEAETAFGPVVRTSEPMRGIAVGVSFLEGRPHPLEGDAHPDYWTFLFNNTTRYEIKVGDKVAIVDAQFNADRTITSPQGVTGSWLTEGQAGKDEQMCYALKGVSGVAADLTECFALVLMFNPRLGARWPSRFDQGNTYWAEIVARP